MHFTLVQLWGAGVPGPGTFSHVRDREGRRVVEGTEG